MISEEATFPYIDFESSDSLDLDIWELLSEEIFWNTLIITEYQEIWLIFSQWSKYIRLISENYTRRREVFHYCLETSELIIYWITSLAREYSMISCYHNRHLARKFRSLREVVLMPRMENIKSSKTHYMRIVIFMCFIFAIFRI